MKRNKSENIRKCNSSIHLIASKLTDNNGADEIGRNFECAGA